MFYDSSSTLVDILIRIYYLILSSTWIKEYS